MLHAGVSSEIDLDLYGPPRKRKVRSPTSFRIHPDLERGIEALNELWKIEAKERGDDPAKINKSHVVNRLLRVGLDGAFEGVKKDAGLKALPESEAEWQVFEAALKKRISKAR